MSSSTQVEFSETQYMRQQLWIILIVIGIALLMWWGFIEQIIFGRPWGSNPGPDWIIWITWLIFGIGFPIFFYKLKLTIQLYDDHININYKPLTTRQIAYDEITQAKATTYNPIKEYAGWGVKGWSSQKMAYNVQGNEGVELTLQDGRIVMLGSQKATELELAIKSHLAH